MVRKLTLFGLILFPVMAFAGTPTQALRPDAPFQAQQAKVRSDLSAGEVYAEIAAADHANVLAALDRVSALVADGTVDALPVEQKEAALKDQELVNTVLTEARAASRMICTREKLVGSNMPSRVCMSVAQRERIRQNTLRQSSMGGRSSTAGN